MFAIVQVGVKQGDKECESVIRKDKHSRHPSEMITQRKQRDEISRMGDTVTEEEDE